MTSKSKLPPHDRKKATTHASRRLEQSQAHDRTALPAHTTVWAGFFLKFNLIFKIYCAGFCYILILCSYKGGGLVGTRGR